MDVLHAVEDYPPNFLERLKWTHDADSVSLHENVTICQKFNGLKMVKKREYS